MLLLGLSQCQAGATGVNAAPVRSRTELAARRSVGRYDLLGKYAGGLWLRVGRMDPGMDRERRTLGNLILIHLWVCFPVTRIMIRCLICYREYLDPFGIFRPPPRCIALVGSGGSSVARRRRLLLRVGFPTWTQ